MSKSQTIFIRADGSKAIGMGHLNRAYLIAGMLQERFDCSIKVLMRRDPLGEAFAQRRGLAVLAFHATTMNQEIEFLQEMAFKESPSLLVLDVLENDTNAFYMDCLHKFSAPIAAITDDSFKRVIDADLIVNGNPAQIGQDYSGEGGKYLLGPKYFLMDEAYAGAHQDSPKEKVQKVLITLGASDHNDLLFKLLSDLEDVRHDFSLVLIVSSACGYIDRLKEFLNAYSRKYELYIDAPSLAPFWKQADMAITAGGNTLFERIAARVPGVTLCQLIRQNEIAESFERLGVNKNLGFGPELKEGEIKTKLTDFLNDFPSRSKQYGLSPQHVDGRGLERLGNELQTILKGVAL